MNANGKRVDAWLVYKCTACGKTWNRPILERRDVDSVAPSLLAALHRNDSELAQRWALDVGGLQRHEASADVAVHKEILRAAPLSVRWLWVRLAVPQPVTLRLDRLLGREFGLSRKHLHTLQQADRLVIAPYGPRMLRRPLRDGTGVTLELAREVDAARICMAAGGLP